MKKIVAVICALLTLFAICSCESVLTPNDLAMSFGRLTAANVGTITYVTEVKKDGVVTSLITAVFKGSDRSVFTTEKKLNADPTGKPYTETQTAETLTEDLFNERIPVPNIFDSSLYDGEYVLEKVKDGDNVSITFKVKIADDKIREFLDDGFSDEEIANINSVRGEAYIYNDRPVSFKVTFVMYGADVTITADYEY